MTHDNVTDIVERILLYHESGGHEGSAAGCTEAGNRAIARIMDERDQLRKQLENARSDALEEAAKVADDHAFNAWHIAEVEGQNSACASGRNYGGRAIAQAILALNGQKP